MGEYLSETSIECTMCSRAKCGMSEIGVDIIGTLFSADYIGEPKHAENIVRDHASDRRTGTTCVSYDRFPVLLAPIKETHVRWNFEFFKCSFPDSFHVYISRYVYFDSNYTFKFEKFDIRPPELKIDIIQSNLTFLSSFLFFFLV